jgi:hypothetical protein
MESSLCVSVQDAQTTQSLLKIADLARDATSYGNNVRVDASVVRCTWEYSRYPECISQTAV